MYNGLSLEQAPPISVVMRFFMTVPVIGFLLCILLLLYPDAILTPSHPYSLAAIHLMALGVLTMSMIGALFQMQSVLGGRPIPSPMGNAFLIHLFLLIGVLTLAGAFMYSLPTLFVIASVFLGSSILYTAIIVLPLLFGGVSHDTLIGMRTALIALAITAILGIVMASEYANTSFSASHDLLRNGHYSLGLIGWVGTLIIAVAFQVIEMFYVTTAYSSWCKRNAFIIISAALVLKLVWLLASLPFSWGFDIVIGALLIGFIVTTAQRLNSRKRRVSDVSIWFWGVGITLLSLSILGHIGYYVWGNDKMEQLALISFFLFALSIILGMIGKIVPFLVWFHLNSSGYMDTPIMSNIIPASRSKKVFWLFCLSVSATLIGIWILDVVVIGALLGGTMFAFLLYNLIHAMRLYRYTLYHGTRFEQL